MFRLPMLPEKTTTGSLKTDFPLRGNVGFKNPTYIHKDTTARNSFQTASNAVGTPQRQPETPTQKELPMNPVRIYRTILTAAGKQAGVLKRCLRDSIAAALLQGAGFAMLLPAFLALGAGKNGRAAFWLALLTVLLALSALFRWRSQDYDYQGYCARAGDAARRKMGEHLRRIPLQILYRKRSGELNALLAGTIDETYNHTLIVSNMLIAAVCTPLATALLAMLWDWLGLALLFSFPLIVPIQQWTQPFTERARARLAGANARLNAELLEYSQGLPVLKAANSTGSRLPRLQQAVGEVETIQREALLAEALPNALLGITFENVHYHYDANPEPVLRGITLHIPERALTALVGHSGCGKTTLIRLIMRYADPQQGRVLIGGSDIRALTQQELMRQISVVFQDVYLFDDTIGNNIRLGKADATDAEINEALLMRALAALMQDKSVLMIAHRLATIRHAAQILVFDHGQLVEQGDHASLIAQNGRYARLWQAGEAARHWRIGSAEQ